MHDDEFWTDDSYSFDHKICEYCGKNKLNCTCVTDSENNKENVETRHSFFDKKQVLIICSVILFLFAVSFFVWFSFNN